MNEQHGGRWVLDPGKLPESKTQFHTYYVTFFTSVFLLQNGVTTTWLNQSASADNIKQSTYFKQERIEYWKPGAYKAIE